MGALGRWLSVLAVAASSLVATATAWPAATPAEQLVRAYSPIVMTRAQKDPPCEISEEQYAPPTTVNVVLGNPRVRLVRYPQAKGAKPVVVKVAPTAADIAGLGDRYYLDLPGETLDAGCTYATDFAALRAAGKAPAITYAHIARQPGHAGLVVQYWFFYYFNEFNDVHEGDWEGMQIAFDASTPAEALAQGPSEIALFQHGGGEKGAWDDEKVEKEGTHPVVYSAAGSHATFFSSDLFIGNGQGGSGLGCDNTQEPLTRNRPAAVLVPTDAAPGSRFQWLTYTGRWGQKEKRFNNGPQGPITKQQWLEPFAWMDGIRRTSPTIPGGSTLGPAVSTAFCGVASTLSGYFNYATRTLLGAILVAVGLVILILIPIKLTRWRPVELDELRRPRATGQLLRASRQFYGRHWRTLILLGLVTIPLFELVDLLDRLVGASDQGTTIGFSIGDATFRFAVPIQSIGKTLTFTLIGAAVIAFVRSVDRGAATGFFGSFKALRPCFWRVILGQLLFYALLALLVISIVGIPIALWKFVDWQFIQQEIIFENRSLRDALRQSSRAVRGRWWHTALVALVLFLISVVTGPVITIALVFTTLPPVWIDFLGSVVFALLLPYVAVGRTLLYFDVLAREAEAPANPRWRRALARLRPRPRPEPIASPHGNA